MKESDIDTHQARNAKAGRISRFAQDQDNSISEDGQLNHRNTGTVSMTPQTPVESQEGKFLNQKHTYP